MRCDESVIPFAPISFEPEFCVCMHACCMFCPPLPSYFGPTNGIYKYIIRTELWSCNPRASISKGRQHFVAQYILVCSVIGCCYGDSVFPVRVEAVGKHEFHWCSCCGWNFGTSRSLRRQATPASRILQSVTHLQNALPMSMLIINKCDHQRRALHATQVKVNRQLRCVSMDRHI